MGSHHEVGHVDEELGVPEVDLNLFIREVYDDRELLECGVRRDSMQLPLQDADDVELTVLDLGHGVFVVGHLAEVVEAGHLGLGELGGEQGTGERHQLNALLHEPPLRLRQIAVEVGHRQAGGLRHQPKVLTHLRRAEQGWLEWGVGGTWSRGSRRGWGLGQRASLMNCTTLSRWQSCIIPGGGASR